MKTDLCSHGLLLVLAVAPLALAAPGRGGPAAGGPNCQGDCATLAGDSTPLAFGNEAQRDLWFQIDEERMARELYAAFGAKWELPPFGHIPQAESRHESVLRQLATRAGLRQPSAEPGRFDDPGIQARYQALLTAGLESAESALRTGAYVEEVDIADLDHLIATTEAGPLKDAAVALRRASGHHLSAFVGALQVRGITYEPRLLQADDYRALISGADRPAGRGPGWAGGRGQGRGNGFGCGNACGRGDGVR